MRSTRLARLVIPHKTADIVASPRLPESCQDLTHAPHQIKLNLEVSERSRTQTHPLAHLPVIQATRSDWLLTSRPLRRNPHLSGPDEIRADDPLSLQAFGDRGTQ